MVCDLLLLSVSTTEAQCPAAPRPELVLSMLLLNY